MVALQEPPTVVRQFSAPLDRLGGCFTCRYFGHRIDVAVWCAKPGQGHVRSQADRGCAFWMREPDADDDLPAPEPRRIAVAPRSGTSG